MDFQNIKRIGVESNTNSPIMVSFLRQKNKLALWNNRKVLKNTGYAISEHYTDNVMESIKKLKTYQQKARKEEGNTQL